MIKQATLSELLELKNKGEEGLVFLGTGGLIEDWINGVTEEVESFCGGSFNVKNALVIETSGGRIDTLMLFDWRKINAGRLAIWKMKWGACSWLSDYVVNYAKQHEGEM